MFLNKNEVRAIAQMLEYHDETGDPLTLNEIIGVVRFKIIEDQLEDEEKKNAQKALEQVKESEVSVDK